MASLLRISVVFCTTAILCPSGTTASFAETAVSVLDGSGNDLLAASSPNLGIDLNEGSAITAHVTLNREPNSEVRVSFSSSGLLELDVYNPSSERDRGGLIPFTVPVLTFDSSNWNVPQTVSIRSIEDGTADGSRTLPVRMTVSAEGIEANTTRIWFHSLDSGEVSTSGSEPFRAAGTIDRLLEVDREYQLTQSSNATVLANYDGTKGTAKFRVSSRKLNIKNRIIEVDYIINSQNRVMARQVRGLKSRDLSLDLNYLPIDTYLAGGLSGAITIRRRGVEESFFVTAIARYLYSCDINQYAGKWYEQGSAKTTEAAELVNATYTYTPEPDGSVKVEYAGNYGSINGAAQKAIGVATPVRDIRPYSTNTQFKVSYSSWNSVRPPRGDYRIMDFAPDYSWAIASDRFGRHGIILTRDQVVGDATYSLILSRAKWLGVDTKKITRTVQIALP